MAEFTLPKNSKIKKGRFYKAPPTATRKQIKEFKVYRWDPEGDSNPRLDTH